MNGRDLKFTRRFDSKCAAAVYRYNLSQCRLAVCRRFVRDDRDLQKSEQKTKRSCLPCTGNREMKETGNQISTSPPSYRYGYPPRPDPSRSNRDREKVEGPFSHSPFLFFDPRFYNLPFQKSY